MFWVEWTLKCQHRSQVFCKAENLLSFILQGSEGSGGGKEKAKIRGCDSSLPLLRGRDQALGAGEA